jgi:tRNA-2-methylthio-N6-dimethylallyladenosine synthase
MENLSRQHEEKFIFLETFGCQMNENDSDRMLGFLKDIKYSRTDRPENADLIIINTCSIRDKAEQKVYSILGRFRELKKERPWLIIGVSGCVAQQEGAALLKRVPYLDIVLGPHNIHKLKGYLNEVTLESKKVVSTELYDSIDRSEYSYTPVQTGIKAFVSIMRGCNNFCSYCIVPYTRGREVSRPALEIVEEVVRLSDSGVKEVTLIGQNVNSYGGGLGFPGLLREVAGVPEIERVRFITSHPKDISEELICLFKDDRKLCRHIHLPAQSGSDEILKRMRRGYSVAEYRSKVDKIRGLYPDFAITTDIIVGFPGESELDFERTMELIESVRFDNIFSFMYSPRPKTKAADMDDHVPLEIKSERLKILQETQRDITFKKSLELAGRKVEVLVEGRSKGNDLEISGRTSCNRIVNFPGPEDLTGGLAEVVITDVFPNSLRGELVKPFGRNNLN